LIVNYSWLSRVDIYPWGVYTVNRTEQLKSA
jgi:hypothetical protein